MKKYNTNLKKGDVVQVIAGSDKGTSGPITKIINKKERILVVVEGVNRTQKITKASQGGEQQVVDVDMPIDISNVMLYDKDTKKRTRTERKEIDGKYIRVAKTTGNQI